jgi:hypothetical protein
LALVLATGAIVAAMPARLREKHVQPQSSRRVVAIVVDDIDMTASDVDDALGRFAKVRSALRASDLVAIASTGYSSIATDVMAVPAMTKRLDQAADKIRTSHQGANRQTARVMSPLYPAFVSVGTVHDLLGKITSDAGDSRVLVIVTGPSSFDPFEAIRRLHAAGQPLPAAPANPRTAPGDLSANSVTAFLAGVLLTAEQQHVEFMTLDGRGYFSWKGDGSSAHVDGIGY